MNSKEWVEVGSSKPTTSTWVEVKSYPEPIKKKCEGENCLDYFEATWPSMRRCNRCRREKRPYKSADCPF